MERLIYLIVAAIIVVVLLVFLLRVVGANAADGALALALAPVFRLRARLLVGPRSGLRR